MTITSPRKSHFARGLVLQLVLPLVFVLIMLPAVRAEPFELDPDEGINVMKAMLLAHGFALYEEIWSDQPPLFTYALAVTFRIFGFDVNVARLLVLILSSLLLWAGWQFLRAVGGNTYAFTGCLLIALLPHYTRLSISAMVGLPALAFAVASLSALAFWHKRRAGIWLIVSAITLSLSVLTKAFTGFLVPVFVVGLLVCEFCRQEAPTWQARLRPAALWALIFASVTVALLLLFVDVASVSQLFRTHFAARGVVHRRLPSLENALTHAPAAVLLALLGSVLALRHKQWLALYPIAWLGIGYVLLLGHTPVWYHHELLVAVPAALVGACAIGAVIRWFLSLRRAGNLMGGGGLLLGIVAIAVVLIAAAQVPSMLKPFNIPAFQGSASPREALQDYQIVAKMTEYARATERVVTDRPMCAFRSGLLVPPHLAVISRKRLVTRTLTEQEILDTIRETRPEQVLLARFKWPLITQYLKEHYRVLYSEPGKTLYLRTDLE